ncbi:MAG: hypothetical protein HYR91_10040 [Flavobacteriia bacterium]|nr:hypothetical protein [Flavobacteriia bacterium]
MKYKISSLSILSIILIIILGFSCKSKNKNYVKNKAMVTIKNTEIEEIYTRLKENMINFIEPGVTSYDKKDVEKCMHIIDDYIIHIEKAESKKEAMLLVEKTVKLLNDINEKCGEELIETEQREDIAEIIILSGSFKGFNSRDEDITEEWREW